MTDDLVARVSSLEMQVVALTKLLSAQQDTIPHLQADIAEAVQSSAITSLEMILDLGRSLAQVLSDLTGRGLFDRAEIVGILEEHRERAERLGASNSHIMVLHQALALLRMEEDRKSEHRQDPRH